jgi:hypothetical protein
MLTATYLSGNTGSTDDGIDGVRLGAYHELNTREAFAQHRLRGAHVREVETTHRS